MCVCVLRACVCVINWKEGLEIWTSCASTRLSDVCMCVRACVRVCVFVCVIKLEKRAGDMDKLCIYEAF